MPFNAPQIVTIIVGVIINLLSKQFGVIPQDASDGITALCILIYGFVANDVTDKTVWKQPTTITAILAALFWGITAIAHLPISGQVEGLITSILLAVVGIYTKPPVTTTTTP
jgi:hypothetical protein